jgi:GlcNAc-P-P-Und epimerase
LAVTASGIVVIGASGFIGTHLVRSLVAAGEGPVWAADLKPPRERHGSVRYLQTDVRDLTAVAPDGPVSRIYNLAAVHTTPGHPTAEYYDTNIRGALEVVRLAERLGAPEIVFTSSISVYGPCEERRTEASRPEPVSAYGHSKLIAERVHLDWQARDPARRLVIARPAVVFGPGEGGNFTRLAALLRRGVFVYPGRKDTIKACIYVDDLIEAMEFARQRCDGVVVFNGAYQGRFTLQQIVEGLIAKHFPGARTVTLPRAAVSAAATALRPTGFLDLGIHPERVLKLVRSTDVYPAWLVEHGFPFPATLETAFDRWAASTDGRFT